MSKISISDILTDHSKSCSGRERWRTRRGIRGKKNKKKEKGEKGGRKGKRKACGHQQIKEGIHKCSRIGYSASSSLMFSVCFCHLSILTQ